MNCHAVVACGATVLVLLGAGAARAAAPAAAVARPDSVTTSVSRAGWLSDRLPLRIGDLLTVVVDEQTVARAQVSRTASGDRSMTGNLNINSASGSGTPSSTAIKVASGLDRDSRDQGETSRQGRLHTVMSVRVVSLEPGGLAHVAGARKVTVDGQAQEVGLTGVVRAEDVTAGNLVASSCIADAMITYKGKKIGPNTGIMGRFLGMLWP